MLSAIPKPAQKAIDYFKNSDIGGALKEAVKKARETKDTRFFEKIKIFWSQFWKELEEMNEEKKEVGKDATEAVKRNVDETMKAARETVGLDESVAEKDKESFDEFLAMGVASVKELDKDAQARAYSGLFKIDKAATEQETEDLDIDESMSVAAVGIMTLRKLRRLYNKETDFKKALDKIMALSDKSKYPLKTLLTERVLGLFKIRDDSEGLKFLGRFGIEASAGDYAGAVFGGEGGAASHAKRMLESLSKSPLENVDEVVAFMKDHFFPGTAKSNIKIAVSTINTMIVQDKSRVETKTLAKLAFLIDDSDFEHLVNCLVGRPTALADAG